ncbi:hypothetical protein SDC9_110305 [bioreactor metagenome]|uniref:Uncharacterized protein n=1 Tax=bioreactor metagenome TaxID=1076179 RepID=A0A645BDA1_9ZZZZ
MEFVFSKLFRRIENKQNIIKLIQYNPEVDYYFFLEQQNDNGYQQIILNSSFMISLLEFFFTNKSYDIQEIEFAEDDGEYSGSLRKLINNVNDDRELFGSILDKLKLLKSEDSIEIYKLTLYYDDKMIEFKSNGLIKIDKDSYMDTKEKIESFLNGITNA